MSQNSMNYVHLTNDGLLGSYEWKGKIDLLNIVLIGLSEELPEHDDKNELHRLLSTILSIELSVDEKLGIIQKEYSIPVDDAFRKDVSAMCNLSQGIREKGRAEGRTEGRAEGRTEGRVEESEKIILNMHRKGYTLEQIAECAEKTVDEVEAVIAKKELVLMAE